MEFDPAPVPLWVTNYTDTQLESLAVTVTGNFTEDHSGCNKVKPGDSCVICVTYPPKQSAAAQVSLAFSGTLATTAPKPPVAFRESGAEGGIIARDDDSLIL